jgi:phage repressor protein C with HTH and peptisase S24 domain
MGDEAERYNFIREISGLSKKDFAESLGLSMNMGFQISTGRVRPSREVMERLSSVYNVNLHWFITGEGSPGYNPDTVEIELLDQEAAAGHGRDAADYPGKSAFQVPRGLIAPYRPERLQAVYVAGDSMADEKINDGDIVIFHPGLTEGNGIFVVSIGNTLVVKRVDFDPLNQTVILISANPAYPPRQFSGPALDELRIAGRVLACVHRL